MVDTAVAGVTDDARQLFAEAKLKPSAGGGKYDEALTTARRAERLAHTSGASAEKQTATAALVAEVEREKNAADQKEAADAMDNAMQLFEQAKPDPSAGGGKYGEALTAARKAEQLAHTSGASTEKQTAAAALVAEVEREKKAAEERQTKRDAERAEKLATERALVEKLKEKPDAERMSTTQEEVKKALEERVSLLQQNLQAFCEARKISFTWRGTRTSRTASYNGDTFGSATVGFSYSAGGGQRDVDVQFKVEGGKWQFVAAVPYRSNGPADTVNNEDLLKVLEADKGMSYWLKQGRAETKAGKWDEAIANLTKAIDQEPSYAVPWNERGIAYIRKGQANWAAMDFSKAIELRPNDHVPWTNRGDAHGQMGQWDETIADLSKAIELKGDFEIAWLLRGAGHASLGQWEEASQDFTKAATFPKTALAASARGALVCLRLKDRDGYRQACARLLDKWTESKDPKEAPLVAWICSAAPESGTKLGPIIEVLENSEAKDYLSLRALGAAQYRSGKPQEAIKTLLKALDSRKQPSLVAWIYLAMAHHQLGQQDDARQWLEKAQKWVATASKEDAEVNQADKLSLKSIPWNERLTLELTLREAEELVTNRGKVQLK
jgi:tetratricopeptide (TPR) repeat protein